MSRHRTVTLALTLVLTLGLVVASAGAQAQDFALKLKAGGFVPAPKGAGPLTPAAENSGGPKLYLVQLTGAVRPEWKEGLSGAGAKIGDYIPEYAFLVRMDPATVVKVQALPFVRSITEYHSDYKMDQVLRDLIAGATDAGAKVKVRVVLFCVEDREKVLTRVVSLGGEVSSPGDSPASPGYLTVTLNPWWLKDVATLPEVIYVEKCYPYVLLNDVAAAIVDAPSAWGAGFTGQGEVIGIADTGLDTGVDDTTMHQDFQGKISALFALGRPGNASDPHGHGTHVAGSALGSGANSAGQFRGIAPNARLVLQSVLDASGGLGGLPDNLNTLFQQAWDAGARVHTNSWGANTYGEYTTDSRAVDEFTWNHDMAILFAAGNSGSASGSIASPGSAKNAITVGASENNRPNKGSSSDNPNEVAYFSSRGPTRDGRLKPDVVTPGTWILSARSSLAPSSNFREVYDNYYAYMSGTSMATPLTAGAAAVARGYLSAKLGRPPSPALVKATLINGATDLGGGIPNNTQGHGRLNLSAALFPDAAGKISFLESPAALETGQTQTLAYPVVDSSSKLRFTLVWTDYPSSVVASKALVNDLDLVVLSPSGRRYNGNDFTAPYDDRKDGTNNVEEVMVSAAEIGAYTALVSAANVPSGPQRYALVVAGGIRDDTPSPPGDTIPPQVTITSPTDGAIVSAVQQVVTIAADESLILRTELYLDGVLAAVGAGSPFTYAWDTWSVANGTHTLLAQAYDAAGNKGTSLPVTIVVRNDTSPPDTTKPTASITEPQGGATVQGQVTVRVTATDNVGVTKVYLYIDDNFLWLDRTAPYEFTWNTSTYPNGQHSLQAKAFDAAGNSGWAPAIRVTVQNGVTPPPDTSPPTVSLTSPTPGQVIKGTVSVQVAATDDVGVTMVRVTLNGQLLAEFNAPPYEVRWDSTTVANGDYTLEAEAVDAVGNIGHAAPVTVTVANPDLAMPRVRIVSPPDGSSVTEVVSMSVEAGDNVGVTKLELWVDGIWRGDYSPGGPIPWDTRLYGNGPHELAIRAYDAADNIGTGVVRLVVAN